ncbi:TetR family transcriptional regulator [Isoptericola sp. CG 20/1183]|uniref:TetR family transcriptional regulator n=1 Tax=Isoptericola halotolerans TaxID=300560 RepID=A0ABX5EFW8_9MICO|nr:MULTISPECIES: TetR/AcrR family transcriptional regulator [Isoptericola]PRZ08301.1 TetR family transcriptional regulator [Isoptericola halotolerans]PRZ09098.1 TetR family transcriptional regulator [Isoptericola sp. CG 20/1183]
MATLTPRSLRTRARILDAALDLFERQGYDATTVAQVAAAAGVTQMTFFRHFPTKDSVLVSDPYDPLLARAVAAQPRDLGPVERVRRGLLAALGTIEPVEDATAERRVRLVAAHPALRAAVAAATADTERAITDALVADGVPRLDAAVAAAACLGACTAALLAMPDLPDRPDPTDGGRHLGAVVTRALELLGESP